MLPRIRYYLEPEGVSGFRELCRKSFEYATYPLLDHVHPDAVEICFLYRGSQVYQASDQTYRLNGLDVYLTYPNEVHGSGPQPEEKSCLYYMIIDTVNGTDHFLGFEGGETKWLAERINSIPRRHFRGNERIRILWEECIRVYNTPHPMRQTLLRCTCLALLMEILDCSEKDAVSLTQDIKKVVDYIHAHVEDWLPLAQLAEVCSLSLARFKQKFRQQVGMPPGEFILREKINHAEGLINQGHTVTYVAHQLNFSSSQHLAATFKKYRGYSPRQGRGNRVQ